MLIMLLISSFGYGGSKGSLNIFCEIVMLMVVVVFIVSIVVSVFSVLNFISIVLCNWCWVVFSVCSIVLLQWCLLVVVCSVVSSISMLVSRLNIIISCIVCVMCFIILCICEIIVFMFSSDRFGCVCISLFRFVVLLVGRWKVDSRLCGVLFIVFGFSNMKKFGWKVFQFVLCMLVIVNLCFCLFIVMVM